MESAFVLAEKPLLEILTQVRNGLPAPMFEQVASALGLSTSTLAAKLGIARRTLTRKRGQWRTPVQRDFGEVAAGCAGTQSRPRTVYDRRSGIGMVIEARAGLGQYGAPRFIGHRLRRP